MNIHTHSHGQYIHNRYMHTTHTHTCTQTHHTDTHKHTYTTYNHTHTCTHTTIGASIAATSCLYCAVVESDGGLHLGCTRDQTITCSQTVTHHALHTRTRTHTCTHTHTHTSTCITTSRIGYVCGPHSGGEPAGGNKTGGPVGSGDTNFISPVAWPPQCSRGTHLWACKTHR